MEAIAGHIEQVLGEVVRSAAAQQARVDADAARAAVQRTLDDATARQAALEGDIADHQASTPRSRRRRARRSGSRQIGRASCRERG